MYRHLMERNFSGHSPNTNIAILMLFNLSFSLLVFSVYQVLGCPLMKLVLNRHRLTLTTILNEELTTDTEHCNVLSFGSIVVMFLFHCRQRIFVIG